MPVHFKVFDIDDPFDQLHGVNGLNDVADVGIIDNDTVGGDNRPAGTTDPAVRTYSATTDASGDARVTVTVSMQPGNNYRAGASVLVDALVQNTMLDGQPVTPQQHADALSVTTNASGQFIKNGDFAGYEVPVVWSKMLTVWRKLWVERDTMQAPDPTQLRVTGSIAAIFPTPGRLGLTTVQIGSPANDSLDLNNYEEGRIIFTDCPGGADTFSVVESLPGTDFSLPEVILFGLPGACAGVDTGLTVYDDDDPTALGTLQTPHFPDGGQLLTTAFAPAYILPIYAGVAFQDIVPFDEYVSASQIFTGVGSWNNGYDLSSTTDLWSCLVVGAWEGSDALSELSRDGDGDPDDCFNLFMPPAPRDGAETPLTGVRRPGTQQCIVFLQAIADDAGCTDQTDEAHNVVHEIAHSSGDLPHKFGTIMEEGAPKNRNSFDAEQLNILRNQNPW